MNPCLSANSSKSAAPAHKRESPGAVGHYGLLTWDGMQVPAVQCLVEDEQLLRWVCTLPCVGGGPGYVSNDFFDC